MEENQIPIEKNLELLIFEWYGSKKYEKLINACFEHSYQKTYVNEWNYDQGQRYFDLVLGNAKRDLVAYTRLQGKAENDIFDEVVKGIIEKRKLIE